MGKLIIFFAGYTSEQFQGIIRNVFLNGEWITLSEGHTNGLVDVVDCDSPEAQHFLNYLLDELEYYDYIAG